MYALVSSTEMISLGDITESWTRSLGVCAIIQQQLVIVGVGDVWFGVGTTKSKAHVKLLLFWISSVVRNTGLLQNPGEYIKYKNISRLYGYSRV